MKRKILIMMDINERVSTESSSTARLTPHGTDEAYHVQINKEADSAMIDTAAHELGHVLSSVFRIPEGMDDPRTKREFSHLPEEIAAVMHTPEQDARIYKNELLAWDIAEKIRPELDQKDKQESLKSYKEGAKMRQQFQTEIRDQFGPEVWTEILKRTAQK